MKLQIQRCSLSALIVTKQHAGLFKMLYVLLWTDACISNGLNYLNVHNADNSGQCHFQIMQTRHFSCAFHLPAYNQYIKYESNRFSCLIWMPLFWNRTINWWKAIEMHRKQLVKIEYDRSAGERFGFIQFDGWTDGTVELQVLSFLRPKHFRAEFLFFFFSRIEIHTFSWVVHNAAREFSIKHFISKLVQKERKKEKWSQTKQKKK